ncbi:MAG: hypothetical protein R2764_07925 [Bacteroidales bacterium]
MVYKPKINFGYHFKIASWLTINPLVFIGYSFLSLSNKEFEYTEMQKGINSGTDLRLVWNNAYRLELYLFGRYDFIYLSEDENFTRLEYYRKVHLSSVAA